MKIDHILLTTDLSDEALRPAQRVAELAALTGARVTMLHVLPELVAIPYGGALAPPLSPPDSEKRLAAARKTLGQQRTRLGDDVKVEADVVPGDKIHETICNYAEKHDVDLIAISTHGRTGFRHLVLGSVAEAVLQHAKVPVIAFPQKG